ncbi:hypothetical protein MBLNU230_g5546t1 [Neophaeotheca triangularis]
MDGYYNVPQPGLTNAERQRITNSPQHEIERLFDHMLQYINHDGPDAPNLSYRVEVWAEKLLLVDETVGLTRKFNKHFALKSTTEISVDYGSNPRLALPGLPTMRTSEPSRLYHSYRFEVVVDTALEYYFGQYAGEDGFSHLDAVEVKIFEDNSFLTSFEYDDRDSETRAGQSQVDDYLKRLRETEVNTAMQRAILNHRDPDTGGLNVTGFEKIADALDPSGGRVEGGFVEDSETNPLFNFEFNDGEGVE